MFFTPPNGAAASFTSNSGTIYTSSAGAAVDIAPGDIVAAYRFNWTANSLAGYPGITDLPVGTIVAQKLYQSAIPFIVAPTGSVAANGALTSGTALPAIFPVSYVNLPAGAAYAGSLAGWYYVVWSSTTVGQIFNNTYVSGQPFVPVPAIPIVAAGPGAYTGVTSAVNGPTLSVNGGTLGVNGALRLYADFAFTGAATSKTTTITYGGSNLFTDTQSTAANLGQTVWLQCTNQGVANAQVVNPLGQVALNTTADSYLSVNSANAQNVVVALTHATATEYLILNSFTVEVISG